jgi:hypothetical protein
VLAALAASFNESKVPIRYLQLDPWWFNGESCGDATSFTPNKDLFPGAHRWRKTSFLCHFVLEVKLIISPRQARDKHKKPPEKRARERERHACFSGTIAELSTAIGMPLLLYTAFWSAAVRIQNAI